jgi:predicted HNH restriction endonuclease
MYFRLSTSSQITIYQQNVLKKNTLKKNYFFFFPNNDEQRDLQVHADCAYYLAEAKQSSKKKGDNQSR